MASDNYYDGGFDYNSSQDYLEIEYQIDLFEIRQCSKAKRHYKQKVKIPSYPFSRKTPTRKSQHPLVRVYGLGDKKTLEADPTIFHYTRYLPKRKKDPPKLKPKRNPPKSKKHKNDITIFECDQQFRPELNCVEPNLSLETERPRDFADFCRQFYHVNHQQIKSSLKNLSHVGIINIRLAPINKSVQDNFMKLFQEKTSYYPHLVYHGTKLDNIESILRYGFLIPNQPHPTNSEAPIITTQNGNAYGTGIYCSETAHYSLSYSSTTTNTLLVCAAIPQRNEAGSIERSHGNIIVLSHVSEVIPLFLIDFQYLNAPATNNPWYKRQYTIKRLVQKKADKPPVEDDPNRPLVISRKYLRKVLNYAKDLVPKRRRHRGRRNNRHKVHWEDEYQVRIFEPFI